MLFTVSLSWAKGGHAARQKKQFRRVGGGVKSGEITRREFKRLGREQWRIGQTTKNARADGRYSARERHRIHKLQNRASRHIYRTRHNEVRRHGYKPHYRHKYYWHGTRHLHYPTHYWHRSKHHGYPVYYWHEPTYDGYHFKGRYADPYFSFAWSIGWW